MVCPMRFFLVVASVLTAAVSTVTSYVMEARFGDDDGWAPPAKAAAPRDTSWSALLLAALRALVDAASGRYLWRKLVGAGGGGDSDPALGPAPVPTPTSTSMPAIAAGRAAGTPGAAAGAARATAARAPAARPPARPRRRSIAARPQAASSPMPTPRSASAAPAAAPPAPTTVVVELGDRAYPIHIGAGLLDRGDLLAPHVGRRALVVTNETVGPLYLDRLTAALAAHGVDVQAVVLPDGEQYKTVETLMQVWDAALQGRHGRDTTFVALGGGVVGDMTGFAAAAYQRGVAFVQVPTTVMATVDSSVGGKTGVNHPLGKNMVGAFHQPHAVLIDVATLDTLPDRELRSGLSEVVKYGLIRDAALFEWLEANVGRLLARDRSALTHAVEQSCVNKAAVVAADEREGGVRATLNLGHTFGHAIETAAGYGEWLHGEAVAAGTVMAADMSARLGWIEPGLRDRAVALLEACGLPVAPPPGMTAQQFRDIMAVDKKVKDGKLRLILLKGPLGGCVVTGDFDPAALDATLAAFCRE